MLYQWNERDTSLTAAPCGAGWIVERKRGGRLQSTAFTNTPPPARAAVLDDPEREAGIISRLEVGTQEVRYRPAAVR